MPVHDWTKVDAGVFHDFHQSWIISIRNALNRGLLPDDYYALAEQVTTGPVPDVVTLERISGGDDQSATAARESPPLSSNHSLALAENPPQTRYRHSVDLDIYAGKATQVVIRHVSGDRVVAYVEVVSPGNKHSLFALNALVDKLAYGLRAGVHLLVLDLHPPTRRDPRGVHAYFWETQFGDESVPGVDAACPLGMASYCAELPPLAFFEPLAVGDRLLDMPIFLTPDRYISLPLESTYQVAWDEVPRRWRDVVE